MKLQPSLLPTGYQLLNMLMKFLFSVKAVFCSAEIMKHWLGRMDYTAAFMPCIDMVPGVGMI